MKRSTRKAVWLLPLMLLAASCAKSNYNLLGRDRVMMTQVKESRVRNAPMAPMPRILPETHFAAARMFEAQGQLGKAIGQYRKAIAVNHNYAAAYHRLGLLLSRISRHDDAIAAFQQAVRLNPDSAPLRNNYGFELMFVQRWNEAEAQLRKATELDPTFARGHINLAMALSKQDRFDEALASFLEVLPEPDAHYNLGLLYKGQRRLGQAAATFQYVLTLNPGFTAARKRLTELAEQVGEDALGERAARMARGSSNDSSEPRLAGTIASRPGPPIQTNDRTDSTSPVRKPPRIREFVATNRLAEAKRTPTPGRSTQVRQPRVSRARGRAPESDAAPNRDSDRQNGRIASFAGASDYHDSFGEPILNYTPFDLGKTTDDTDEPLFASPAVATSIFETVDPDCDEDSVVTITDEVDRDRFLVASAHDDASWFDRAPQFMETDDGTRYVRPTWPDAAASLNPKYRKSSGLPAVQTQLRHVRDEIACLEQAQQDRPSVTSRPLTFRETRTLLASASPKATAHVQPTVLRGFARMQISGQGPEMLSSVIGQDGSRRARIERARPKPVLVKDRPMPRRGAKRRGLPRTDTRGIDAFPPFFDARILDPEFIRSQQSDRAKSTHSKAAILDEPNDSWAMDFDGLDALADVVANEILCREDLKAQVVFDPRPTNAAATQAADSDIDRLACPADGITDFDANMSMLPVQPEPVCDPTIPDAETDTITVGDARVRRDVPTPETADRVPAMRD